MSKYNVKFDDLDEEKKRAVGKKDGPLLVIAGPGTGKTLVLVQRVVRLIEVYGVKPEHILVATYTEKAANELKGQIVTVLQENKRNVNIDEMYIGTFHSICKRILNEHMELTRLSPNYRVLDGFNQKYFVYDHIDEFKKIDGYEALIREDAFKKAFKNNKLKNSDWHIADSLCAYINKLSEELVDSEQMSRDGDERIAALGKILMRYRELLNDANAIDFSGLQTECHELLSKHSGVLEELHDRIEYLMIDEYQDTNYVQEQLVLLLGKKHNNICAVGDDDQALYRFRGATVQNILQFQDNFPKGECELVNLGTNYRSSSDIVEFCNGWMTKSSVDFGFDFAGYRLPKEITANRAKSGEIQTIPAVVKLSGGDPDEWAKDVCEFIKDLKNKGKISDYNQVVFLAYGVKPSRHPNTITGEWEDNEVICLMKCLIDNHIGVCSPRSNMFFERDEIRFSLGCLIMMFPDYENGLKNGKYNRLGDVAEYYKKCVGYARHYLGTPERSDLNSFIDEHGRKHGNPDEGTDYAFSGLLYRLFRFEDYRRRLDIDIRESDYVSRNKARNLAILTQKICDYERLKGVEIFYAGKIESEAERFFNGYLSLLYSDGVDEYEDASEYAPSGCVSFMTIHQAKGLEFPIVIVDSLWQVPRDSGDALMDQIEKDYFIRKPFEQHKNIKNFDFWRLYYTAFSRARNLLVLTCGDSSPSGCFKKIYDERIDVSDSRFDLTKYNFDKIEKTDLKRELSFTSDIELYEVCPLRYKFFKELGFMPAKCGPEYFGDLVHMAIESVHRAAIRGEADSITRDKIAEWLEEARASIEKRDVYVFIDPLEMDDALRQVERYVNRMAGRWDEIIEAEVPISQAERDYIINGRIDLVRGKGDAVEIVDFKSGKKPVSANDARLKRYRRQIELYAHLFRQKDLREVSGLNLYFTGDESDDPVVSFPYSEADVKETMDEFDTTARKILAGDFSGCASDSRRCVDCDFRFYCHKA